MRVLVTGGTGFKGRTKGLPPCAAETDALSKTAPERHLRALQERGAPISTGDLPDSTGTADCDLGVTCRDPVAALMGTVRWLAASGAQTRIVRCASRNRVADAMSERTRPGPSHLHPTPRRHPARNGRRAVR